MEINPKKLIISLALLQLMLCCKKENGPPAQNEILSIGLNSNEAYQFNLGFFGDEEGVTIIHQASHYVISNTNRDIHTGEIIFNYNPDLNYIGTDEVEIESERGSNGASPNNKILRTTIKFNISQ